MDFYPPLTLTLTLTLTLSPDRVLWSDKLKKVLWIELTSPWDENMNDWHFKKLRKYQKLERTAKRNG